MPLSQQLFIHIKIDVIHPAFAAKLKSELFIGPDRRAVGAGGKQMHGGTAFVFQAPGDSRNNIRGVSVSPAVRADR